MGKPGFPTPLLRATPSQPLPPGEGLGKPGFPRPLRGGGLGADRTHERRGALWRWDALIGPHPLPLSRARERGAQSRALGRPNAVEAALARMFCPPLNPSGGRAGEGGNHLARGDATRAGRPRSQAMFIGCCARIAWTAEVNIRPRRGGWGKRVSPYLSGRGPEARALRPRPPGGLRPPGNYFHPVGVRREPHGRLMLQ